MDATPVPPRTPLQRAAALQRANRVRQNRAALKRAIRHGRADPCDILSDPPDWAYTMKVWDLVMALNKFGRVKTGKVFREAQVSPSKTLDGINDRQRADLIRLLS